jgi:hypothetical protein
MGEPRAQVIAAAVEENLRLVFEPAKGLRVDHAVAVALVLRPPERRFFALLAAAGVGAELRVRREGLAFTLFKFFAGLGHVALQLIYPA